MPDDPVMRTDAHRPLALRMVEDAAAMPVELGEEALRGLAWALKDAGYAAWSSDPARVARVAEALGRLRAHDAVVAGPPALRAEVAAVASWIDGIADLTRGRMTEASAALDEASAAFRRLALDLEAARAAVPRMMALSILGRHAEAAALGEATQRELLALGDRPAASKVALNLGNLYCRCNDYALAMRHYREAAVLFARIGDHERSIMSDVGMADALAATGDFDESLRIGARARMRAARHGFPVLGALADEAIALVALSRGRYHDALAGLERCRRCYEALDMPQHVAIAEKQLADVYVELRLLPEALALLDDVLDRFTTLEMPVEKGWAFAQRGRALAVLGEDPADAAFADAAKLFAEQDVAAGEAVIALARAELALRGGAAGDAERLAAEAHAAYERLGLAEGSLRAAVVVGDATLLAGDAAVARARFVHALGVARSLHLRSVEVRCLAGMGLAALAEGDVVAGREACEAAIEAFEEQRRLLPNDDIRQVFLTDHLRPYLALLRLALAAATDSGSSIAAAAVLDGLERFRARVLDERLGTAGDAPDERAASEDDRALRARLDWLYRRMQRQDEEGEVGIPADEARRIEHALLERGRRRAFAGEGSGARDVPVDRFDAARLQAALEADEALVAYGVLDGQLFACVATRERVAVVPAMAAWTDVVQAIDAARFQIDTLRHGSLPVARHLDVLERRTRARMAALHALVWAPLAPLVAACPRIAIVPHERLAAVPFAALHDGAGYLLETHVPIVVPSAQVFLRGRARRPVAPERVLAVGETGRLPQAAAEVAFVASLFDGTTTLTGPLATVDNVRTAASGADVLHLACHAQFRADNPRFSALHLADGALTVDVVESLALRPATVVLSACETGLAAEGAGDEMVGLVRAFLLAGAARVVGSLWPVDDAITARFMTVFYEGLRAAAPTSLAIREAQRVVMAQHPHPGHWAAFAAYGGF